jgi:hypothetical protein
MAAACSIAILFGVNVYRAATQSITFDEANTYGEFLSGSIGRIFVGYNVNNHLLQSLLSKLAVQWFGLSELSLRLPSLLAGLFYLVLAWRLGKHLFGAGWLALATLLLLGLNPFVLDYFSAARGYGPGLAFLLWAVYEAARWQSDGGAPRLYRAGLACGLAVATNLIYAAPVLGLGVLMALWLVVPGGAQGFWTLIDSFAGPGFVAGFVFLVVPLNGLQQKQFYYGSKLMFEFGLGTLMLSVFHNGPALALITGRPDVLSRAWSIAQGALLLPLAALVAAIARWLRARLRPSALDRDEALLLLCGFTLAAGLVTSIALHAFLSFPYPFGRTAIYWAPLVSLALMATARQLLRGGRLVKLLAIVPLASVLACLSLFAAGFTVDHYNEWLYDRSTKTIMKLILRRHVAAPQSQVRAAASWMFAPSVNFYRVKYHMDWLQPLGKLSDAGPFDYYLLEGRDWGQLKQRNLRTIFIDERAKVVVAAP